MGAVCHDDRRRRGLASAPVGQSCSVSAGAVRRRTNRSERGSATGATRPAACSTLTPAADGVHQHQVDLAHLRQVDLELGDPADQVLHRCDVDLLAAAVAEQQRRRLDRPHRLGGVEGADRRDPVGAVADEVGERAGDAEGDGRPEERVLETRDRDRDAGRRGALHHELGVRGVGDHLLERGPRRRDISSAVVDVAPHVAEVGALAQPLGGRLEHDVPAELLACRDRLLDAWTTCTRSHRSTP